MAKCRFPLDRLCRPRAPGFLFIPSSAVIALFCCSYSVQCSKCDYWQLYKSMELSTTELANASTARSTLCTHRQVMAKAL
ncbi:uncharacterized protein BDV14DRAFT_181583 [Aspergillus stella-maris]|uniref:uncharacterized protein n=1 Tax=Aspergillus stella-maris TaxID=1810926 RepID=UPI003CCCA23E